MLHQLAILRFMVVRIYNRLQFPKGSKLKQSRYFPHPKQRFFNIFNKFDMSFLFLLSFLRIFHNQQLSCRYRKNLLVFKDCNGMVYLYCWNIVIAICDIWFEEHFVLSITETFLNLDQFNDLGQYVLLFCGVFQNSCLNSLYRSKTMRIETWLANRNKHDFWRISISAYI